MTLSNYSKSTCTVSTMLGCSFPLFPKLTADPGASVSRTFVGCLLYICLLWLIFFHRSYSCFLSQCSIYLRCSAATSWSILGIVISVPMSHHAFVCWTWFLQSQTSLTLQQCKHWNGWPDSEPSKPSNPDALNLETYQFWCEKFEIIGMLWWGKVEGVNESSWQVQPWVVEALQRASCAISEH